MTALLTVDGLSKSFGGLHALSGVSFSVQHGEVFAVIGPNGAGKTTLFNCLSGALRANAGTVHFKGQRIDGAASHDICRHGLVRTFQIVKPFRGMTVAENVKVAAFSRHASAKKAEQAAQAVLEDLGMDDLADVDADTLNVADLRRLEIARALATEPQLLLLDEMLAGLTGPESQAMCAQIKRLSARGLAVIVVEHSVPVVLSLCENAVVLNFGEMLTSGRTQDVIRDPRVQEAYLGGSSQ
ncbi:ABC transporter ATP-binding protein [Alcaligenaceae bacterium]|nr:ABC transporter ATP-binding protein [Alcaligenaceae bacterium]